jgi:hypothetical protein
MSSTVTRPVPGGIQLTVDAATMVARAHELARSAPIRHLILHHASGLCAQLATLPELSTVTALSFFDNGLDDTDVAVLARSPRLGALRWLDLGRNRIGDAGVEALAASTLLPALAYVNLASNPAESPIETFGIDDKSGKIVPESIALPENGVRLERRFGPRAWLHAPSHLPSFPPMMGDLD